MMRKTKMSWCLCGIAVLAGALVAQATPISARQAQRAVRNWVASGDTMRLAFTNAVSDTETCAAPGAAGAFHVVRFKNQGFVVTSGEDTVEPIIAFSDSCTWTNDASSPLYQLLVSDLSNRVARTGAVSGGASLASASPASATATGATTNATSAAENEANANRSKWATLLNPPATLSSASPVSDSSISDLRRPKIVQSKWGQSTAEWRREDAKNCFNWYTPSNYPCGCVATAMAQVMR